MPAGQRSRETGGGRHGEAGSGKDSAPATGSPPKGARTGSQDAPAPAAPVRPKRAARAYGRWF